MTVSDTIERVARAWAVMDGKADKFDAGKDHAPDHPDYTGHYDGYMCEAEDLLTALRPGDELPNGLVVVSRRATDEMIEAARETSGWHDVQRAIVAAQVAIGPVCGWLRRNEDHPIGQIWSAMLSASRPEGDKEAGDE